MVVPSNYVVFIEKPATIEVRAGMVHIKDQSGNLVIERVMPVHVFLQSLRYSNEMMAKWQVDRIDNAVVPMRPKRGGKTERG